MNSEHIYANADPASTDEALHELTGGTFHGLSPEDAAVVAAWGEEARDAHVAAQAAHVGQSVMHETATVATPEDDQLVTVGGNMTVTQGALSRYEEAGQDMSGPYSGNRRG